MKTMNTLRNKLYLTLLLALMIIPSAGSVAYAQEATATVGTTTIATPAVAAANNHSDGFPWGLLGLAGLAGLAGLRPKEQTHTVERTTERPVVR